jgi:hypothetical protein
VPTEKTANFDIQLEDTLHGSDPHFIVQNVTASTGTYTYTPATPIVESTTWVMRFIPIANHSAVPAETTFDVSRDSE